MKSNGTVLKLDGEFAIVGVKQHSACDTCRAKCGGHCGKATTVETKVKNKLKANIGDKVTLYTKTSTVLTYSFAVFVMPIIFAFLGFGFARLLNLSNTLSIICAVFMLFLSFAIVRLIWGKKEPYEKIQMVEITEKYYD